MTETPTYPVELQGAQFPLSLPRVSHEAFVDFCQRNPDLAAELTSEGQLIIMPPADAFGDSRNIQITTELELWNRTLPTPGLVFGQSAGFTLPNGAVRSPDAAWVSAAHWSALTPAQQETFAQICPEFVVELMSPTDRLKVTQAKMDEYIANGALLGFLIDRKTKQFHIYRPGQKPQILINPVSVSGDPELPGFVLPLARIF